MNKQKIIINILIVISLGFILNACASFYNPTVEKPTPYKKPLVVDKDFDISGRFSIKTSQKNEYGNFTWTKIESSENLELRSPIGNTVAKITVESGIVTLNTQDKIYSGNDLDSLLQQNLGFVLPMESLHYWIQGIELPNVPIDKKLNDGFSQLGWDIEYLSWSDPNHPKVIQCTKGDLVIKLLLNW